MVYFKDDYNIQSPRRGLQHFPGRRDQLFSRKGVQLLTLMETFRT